MTKSAEPLVSIVTPVFDGEEHLRECIESVLAQTYSNWDYTIVNNCSTDRTLEIAREYSARDPRIRVCDNACFVPVVENHNVAFRQISPLSKYCKVVAADDWLFPDCLEKMVRVAEENPGVGIVGARALLGDKVVFDGLPESQVRISGAEACRRRLLGGPYVFGGPTSVLYCSDIVRSRDRFYNEDNLSADAEVCFEFLQHRDFGFVHEVLSFMRVRENSTTSYATRLRTYVYVNLLLALRYGPIYLSGDEMRKVVKTCLRHYHNALGRELFSKYNAGFWAYHRDKLIELGYPLSYLQLCVSMARVVVDRVLLHPVRTARILAGRVSGS